MPVYIEKYENKWIVKREGSDEILASYYSKQKAIESAKEIALGSEAEPGTIENLNEFGIDPFPAQNNATDYREDDSEI